MSPYNATKNTNVCSANPTAVGHPLGDATDEPNRRLPIPNAVGLASTKNSSVVYNEYLNFSPSESAIIFLMRTYFVIAGELPVNVVVPLAF